MNFSGCRKPFHAADHITQFTRVGVSAADSIGRSATLISRQKLLAFPSCTDQPIKSKLSCPFFLVSNISVT